MSKTSPFYLQNKSIDTKVLGLVICSLVMSLMVVSNFIYAQTVDELKEKIDATSKISEDLDKEIAEYQAEITSLGKQKNTLENAIKSLNLNIKQITANISLTNNDIKKTRLKIEALALSINDKERKIGKNLEVIRSTLNDISHSEDYSFLENLIRYQKISEAWDDVQTILKFQNQVKDQTIEVKEIKAQLENDKREQEANKRELEQLLSQYQDRQKILEATKVQKNNLLKQTNNNEVTYRELLADRQAKKEAFDRELENYENALRLAVDPSSIPKTGKGILLWPLNKIVITQRFGKTVDSVRLYASGTHNGVDFGIPVGSLVKAAKSGTIEGTGDTDLTCYGASYGKWVLIKHSNGLSTLYGHLSFIKVKEGDTVHTGDLIGYSGNTGYSTGPHLHFTVYASQGVKISNQKSVVCGGTYTMPIASPKAYLDPLAYL